MAKVQDLTKLVGDIGIGNGLWPDKHGPRSLTYTDTLDAATPFPLDLTMVSVRGFLKSIQSVWVDNSAGSNVLTVTCEGTAQVISVPAGVATFYTILLSRDTPKLAVQRADAGAFSLIFLNVPVPSSPSDLTALIAVISAAALNTGLVTRYLAASVLGTNAANVKASAGSVKSIQVENTLTTTVYLQLYNKASAPIPGTDVPVKIIPIPAMSVVTLDNVLPFTAGIGFALANTGATNDAAGVAAGAILALNIDYV